jgi:NADH-quinone oxidoreductase subunit I
MAIKVKRAKLNRKWYFFGIIKGLRLTFKKLRKNLFNKKKMQTLNYPEERYEYGPRFKGGHVLTVKKDGSLRCTACMLCATNCPADCITITATETDNPEVEKYPIQYEIDVLRCVYCGFCEEACPVDAIRMGPEWQRPGINGSDFNYDIKELAHRRSLAGGIESRVDDAQRAKHL